MKNMKNIFLIVIALMFAMASTALAITDRLGANLPVQFSATKTLAKTAAYTVTTSDAGALIEVTCTSADITITMLDIATIAGTSFPVKIIKKDATAYDVIVTPAAGNTIGKESTRYIIGDESYIVIHNEAKDWKVDYESAFLWENHELGTFGNGVGSGGTYSATTGSGTVTLTESDCGNIITMGTGTTTYALPATVANCEYTFINGVGGSAAPMTVDPVAADNIYGGCTLASSVVTIDDTAGDGVINTGATAVKGDYIRIRGDGNVGWYITGCQGIWAEL